MVIKYVNNSIRAGQRYMEVVALPNMGEESGKVVCSVEGKLVTEGVQRSGSRLVHSMIHARLIDTLHT